MTDSREGRESESRRGEPAALATHSACYGLVQAGCVALVRLARDAGRGEAVVIYEMAS